VELLSPSGDKQDTRTPTKELALALVTQAAATELTKALNTLSSGVASEQRGRMRVRVSRRVIS
jgi:hypothetical protein